MEFEKRVETILKFALGRPRASTRLSRFKQSYMYVHCAVIARKTNLIIFSNNF